MDVGEPAGPSIPDIFVFNPFAEGYIAYGPAFTPVKHQAMLAEDLANLPQFLCGPGDVVLVPRRPSDCFLNQLMDKGFGIPEFVELQNGRIEPDSSLLLRKIGRLRPWAWGPDTLELFAPNFHRTFAEPLPPHRYFNDAIARLYSKAWSAQFLRNVLTDRRAPWLCSEHEAGVAVDSLKGALQAIERIRGRGHHRVAVKQALGLAGHNAIRLWEPQILPAQQKWLARALEHGHQVVVEPWLERELDFSVQLEMGSDGLQLCGYTGLVNDPKGQFMANWAEPDYRGSLPLGVPALFPAQPDIAAQLEHFYGEIFTLLEPELRNVGFVGPISIDAFAYRTPQGDCRLKPVVEINPRYTMGRLTVELMKHTCLGSRGVFRLVNQTQAEAEDFSDLSRYGSSLLERLPVRLQTGPAPKILNGAVCLNDPAAARACLATFEVTRP